MTKVTYGREFILTVVTEGYKSISAWGMGHGSKQQAGQLKAAEVSYLQMQAGPRVQRGSVWRL